MKWILIGGMVLLASLSFRLRQTLVRKDKLSEYGFFEGALAQLSPAPNVVPYDLNTPLFSNYAEKLRFMVLPPGAPAIYNDSVVLAFPPGTVLIKNFYYPLDFRKPEKGRRILETRMLVNTGSTWEAWPYIWNDEQTEAYYDPAGELKTVTYIDAGGKKVTTPYALPNKNQCRGCHVRNQAMVPLGPSARQLNREFTFQGIGGNQLAQWRARGMLTGLPPEAAAVPRLAVWNEASSGTLDNRARAYLDANCAHCHSRQGPASTSGLFLDINEKNPSHLGVHKPPVAAGRGAGDLQYDIVPGEPAKSILLFRMKANDPAIAMPEIGREQVHREGVALIEEWIRKNAFQK